jgi:hypothetical protein
LCIALKKESKRRRENSRHGLSPFFSSAPPIASSSIFILVTEKRATHEVSDCRIDSETECCFVSCAHCGFCFRSSAPSICLELTVISSSQQVTAASASFASTSISQVCLSANRNAKFQPCDNRASAVAAMGIAGRPPSFLPRIPLSLRSLSAKAPPLQQRWFQPHSLD